MPARPPPMRRAVNDDSNVLTSDEVNDLQLFGDLPGAALEAIAKRCRVRRFAVGEHILHLHDESSELFFVLEGRARVLLYSPSGREVSFRDLLHGEVFGELAAIDGGPRSASVMASVPTRLAVMTRRDFLDLVRAHSDVAEALLRHLVALIRRYSQRVYELSAMSVEERIRMEILRLALEQHDGSNNVTLSPAPSLADLASLISTTREAVSREISRLSRDGLVERQGRDLVVSDLTRLSTLVEDSLA